MNKLFLCGVALVTIPVANALGRPGNIFDTISHLDLDSFHTMLSPKKYQVNATNSAGNTPLMELITLIIPTIVSVQDRKATMAGLAIFTGAVSGYIGGLITGSSMKSIMGGIAGGLATGIGAGFGSHALLTRWFVQHKEHELEVYSSMINLLISLPHLDTSVQHDMTGKNVLTIINEILTPKYISEVHITYHHSNVNVGPFDFGTSTPTSYTTLNAQFMVNDKPYIMTQYYYDTFIKPLFEALYRQLTQRTILEIA